MARFVGIFAVAILAVLSTSQISDARTVKRDAEEVEDIAGFMLYRIVEGKLEYILLKKIGEDDWSPPKGHVEANETDHFDAAIRETFEETGLLREDYQAYSQYKIYFEYTTKADILKKVSLWPARLLSLEKPIVISDEHEKYEWLQYDSGFTTIKHQYADALREGDNIVRAIESSSC